MVVEEARVVIRNLRDEEGDKEEREGRGVGLRFTIYASSMVRGVNGEAMRECQREKSISIVSKF